MSARWSLPLLVFCALLACGVVWCVLLQPPWAPSVLALGSLALVVVLPALGRRRFDAATAWLSVLFALLLGLGVELIWSLPDGFGAGAAGGAFLAMQAARLERRRERGALLALGVWLLLAVACVAAVSPQARDLAFPPLLLGLGWAAGAIMVRVAHVDEHERAAVAERLAREAEAALLRGDQDRARLLADRACSLAPEKVEMLELRYEAWKYLPRTRAFHAAAAAIFGTGDPRLIRSYYPNYLAVTQVRPRLPEEQHLALAGFFAGDGDPDEGARIVNLHLQRNQQAEGLPGALLAVAEGFEAQGKGSRAARFAETLVSIYPDAYQAAAARRILERVGLEVG